MANYCYEHPRPSVTVDILAFSFESGSLRVLLVRRKSKPFAGSWAIPGGFVEIEERVEDAARRELREETGLAGIDHLRLFGVFSEPGRDPRGRTISLAHLGIVRPPTPQVVGADDAAEAGWRPVGEAKGLAFDHDQILGLGLATLESGLDGGTIGLGLLGDPFSIEDLKSLLSAFGRPASTAASWIRLREKEGRIARLEGKGRIYREIAGRDALDRGESGRIDP